MKLFGLISEFPRQEFCTNEGFTIEMGLYGSLQIELSESVGYNLETRTLFV